jgi:hypothetical protein
MKMIFSRALRGGSRVHRAANPQRQQQPAHERFVTEGARSVRPEATLLGQNGQVSTRTAPSLMGGPSPQGYFPRKYCCSSAWAVRLVFAAVARPRRFGDWTGMPLPEPLEIRVDAVTMTISNTGAAHGVPPASICLLLLLRWAGAARSTSPRTRC